jgi:hypothetical protein
MMKKNEYYDEFNGTTTITPDRRSCLSEPPTSLSPSSPSSSEASPSFKSTSFTENEEQVVSCSRKKLGNKAKSFAYRVRDHVKMGPKLSETVKGKLSIGAKIIKKGGRENIFRDIFGMNDGEKLLKASQCYISTTAGPIAGILFISTLKLAFCSERSISCPNPSGNGVFRSLYKVVIPVKKIKRANKSENVNKPAQKYIEIVTDDDFEFWFMGFVRYEKAFFNLQRAVSMSA